MTSRGGKNKDAKRLMRRTWWSILFMRREDGHSYGQPILVHGGRRRQAIQRASSAMAHRHQGRGWRLEHVRRITHWEVKKT